ncbi:50S ribosomal protein L33 [Lottiidibacillus patelloidae]|uniref:Large ribosomal subunit protein bL33 n=1 Tax=Lottiidibacillus patelloidae TaxID=2670334 RepID=A0A263BR81_9BACI|nr:50S ribosomal protein L33 [Lottiidibacillus patelloidae]OZM55887.1 50S ribosomal protein L33 [Lottiidibacillus patelloidae]
MSQKITLACNICNSRNYSTPTNENARQDRLEIKKFCKSCNAHTIHRETK